MNRDVPTDQEPAIALSLHPVLVKYLKGRSQKSGLSLESEIALLVGEAMQAADIPPAPTNSKFQCSETLMGEMAECKDCGELIRHNAKPWAERHVQITGHNVWVSLHFDMIDGDWLEKLAPERRAELDALRADSAEWRKLAGDLLDGLKSDRCSLQ